MALPRRFLDRLELRFTSAIAAADAIPNSKRADYVVIRAADTPGLWRIVTLNEAARFDVARLYAAIRKVIDMYGDAIVGAPESAALVIKERAVHTITTILIRGLDA